MNTLTGQLDEDRIFRLLVIKMTEISEYDRRNVEKILYGYGDWFGAALLRLIEKADSQNRELLRLGFPSYVEAIETWDKGINGTIEG